MAQLVGWIGTIMFFYGVWALAKKHTLGFYANGIGNLLYTVQAIMMSNYPLLVCSLGLFFVNLYGIYEWQWKKK